MIKIDKGIPVPEAFGKVSKYPWREMEVGDSFLMPKSNQQRASTHACKMAKALGVKFATRKVDGGIRIWRIK